MHKGIAPSAAYGIHFSFDDILLNYSMRFTENFSIGEAEAEAKLAQKDAELEQAEKYHRWALEHGYKED